MSDITQGLKKTVTPILLRSQIILKYFRIRLNQDDIKHSPGKRSGISLGIYCLGLIFIKPFVVASFKQKEHVNYLV